MSIGGGGKIGWWYTLLQIMSIVSMTGTLVKRESTSKDASKPVGLMVRTICKNSSVELIIYLAGGIQI